MGNRKIGGTIPESLGFLPNLELLLLNNNSLIGDVPESLGHMPRLSGLGLFSNKLTSWHSDSICEAIAAGRLEDCEFQDNQFACPLPACAANCSATCNSTVAV